MVYAYDKVYLDIAMRTMANMLDYAVWGIGCDLAEFISKFLESSVCSRFEKGEATIVAGKSGIELAIEVLGKDEARDVFPDMPVTLNRSEEYWIGWVLAYYQWYRNMKFGDIINACPVDKIKRLYHPYHEMDIQHFVDKMDEYCHCARTESRIKAYRKLIGLSQAELAEKANVPLRTLQQYEQRQKNINKAQAEYVIRLADSLNCHPADLLEI